jgi:hypothetical protein
MTLAFLEIGSVVAKAIISAAVVGIAGFFWARSRTAFMDWLTLRRGEVHGKWYGILPAVGDTPERIDTYRVRQRGQTLVGNIKRIRPSDREGQWKLVGYVHGPVIVCVFYTKTPGVDPTSYGVICAHRVPNLGEEGVYRGYYTRPEFEKYERFVDGDLTTRPFIWQRIDPDQKRYETTPG